MTSPRRSLAGGSLLFVLAFLVFCSQPLHAIPAFARKYGLPCSACHEAWPKLNSFGPKLKDKGQKPKHDGDAAIYLQTTKNTTAKSGGIPFGTALVARLP